MRLYIIITALAMSSAVFAQTSAKDSIAAFKAAQKEAKALKAAQLKAFKEKQKADLAAFIKAQQENTTGAAFTLPTVELKDTGDSLAHTFGIAQSNGLKGYMVNQLGVDTAYIAEFCKGIMDAANVDPQNKEKAAYAAGGQIGGQVVNMSKNLRTEAVDQLFEAILCLRDKEECYTFFEDACTINELLSLSQRFEVARMLRDKKTYLEISKKTGASTATISRVNRSLTYGNDGYEMVLNRMKDE